MLNDSFVRGRLFFLSTALVAAAGLAACDITSSGELDTYAGEWCTLGGIGSDDLPVPGIPYISATLLVETNNRIVGSGATSRPTSDTLFPARFAGDILSDRAILLVTDLDPDTEEQGPVFTLEIMRDGDRDLQGTMYGDVGFEGSIRLVRIGPRCFAE